MAYYNTTKESGSNLEEFRAKATTQDKRVIAIFRAIGNNSTICPSGVFSVYDTLYAPAPITSIRRSITNLTKAGLLEKTREKREGPHGRPEYSWRLAAAGLSFQASGTEPAPERKDKRHKKKLTQGASQEAGKQGTLF